MTKSKVEPVECSFCGRDFSHTKQPMKNRNNHEKRVHKKEFEERKNTIHECVECSSDVPYGKLFCRSSCRQRAKAIRYIRSVKRRGIHDRIDIKNAINEKILWAYLGGYEPLSWDVIDAVWERDNSKCVECGEDGSQVDHIQGSNRIEDAKLLCFRCHLKKTQENRRALDPENTSDMEFLLYIGKVYEDSESSKKPQHKPNWDYNKLRKERMRPKKK